MSVVNSEIRFVYEDYKTLPESMAKRYELLDGELLMVPAPSTQHQFICRNIQFALHLHVRTTGIGTVLAAPVDVVLGAGSAREIVQPDVIYICRDRLSIIAADEIRGAPDLVVEILSPGTADRDRTYKKHLYGRYGVREYWIVDPESHRFEIHRSAGAGFELPVLIETGARFSSELLPDLSLDLNEIFRVR